MVPGKVAASSVAGVDERRNGVREMTRGVLILLAGMILGSVLTDRTTAQQRDTGVRLNSVGLSVTNFDEAFKFYTTTFGFREAFTLRGQDGKPTMAFLQISQNTFLQLVPANANRPPGLSSVLLEVDNVKGMVEKLRRNGGELPDPRVSPNTKSTLTSIRDPQGIRVELLELTPGSLIRNAIDRW
jgi:predicted enzyme related to lactoylglutathione lyase